MSGKDDKDSPDKKNKQVETAKDLINRYRANYAEVDLAVLSNLIQLKEITSQPKTERPDKSYEGIKSHLGAAESGETLRQERWKSKVHCLVCGSHNIRRLPEEQQKDKHIYRYQCLDCEECFNDDSETDIEKGIPPLYSWMFCWYLLGCTTSLQYIAQKLNLDVSMVEMMIQHMQKLFKAKQPLTNFSSFEEWSLRHSGPYKKALQESIAKSEELFKGYAVGQAKDTHEVDRQRNRARNPHKPKPTA